MYRGSPITAPTISVWFVCKSCTSAYESVTLFIKHKMENHFQEFQNTKCIVFEETNRSNSTSGGGSHNLSNYLSVPVPVTVPSVPTEPFELKKRIGDSAQVSQAQAQQHQLKFNLNSIYHPQALSQLHSSSQQQRAVVGDHHNHSHHLDMNNFLKVDLNDQSQSQSDVELPINASVSSSSSNSSNAAVAAINPNNFFPFNFNNGLSSFASAGNIYQRKSATEIPHQSPATQTQAGNIKPGLLTSFPLHLQLHPQFECKLCSEKLDSEQELRIHVNICGMYHKERTRFCIPCNKLFFSSQALRLHTGSIHATPEEKAARAKFKCQLCPKDFTSKFSMEYHMESHKAKEEQCRPFKCTECDMSFLSRQNLAYHVKSHSDERPHPCPMPNCVKAFKLKGNLKQHLAVAHSDDKPFNCPEPNCNAKFKYKKSIKDHLNIHTGERPYKCPEENCTQTFSTSTYYYIHKRNFHGSGRSSGGKPDISPKDNSPSSNGHWMDDVSTSTSTSKPDMSPKDNSPNGHWGGNDAKPDISQKAANSSGRHWMDDVAKPDISLKDNSSNPNRHWVVNDAVNVKPDISPKDNSSSNGHWVNNVNVASRDI